MEKNILLGKEEKNIKKNILLKRVLSLLKKKFVKRNINSNDNKVVELIIIMLKLMIKQEKLEILVLIWLEF